MVTFHISNLLDFNTGFWRIVVKILEKLVQICASNLCEIGGGVLGQCLFYGQVNNAQMAEIVCKPQNSQHNFSPSMLFYYPFRIAHSVLVQKNPQKIHFKRRYFPTIELSSLKLTFCATGIRPPWKTDPLGIWPMFVRRKFLRLVSRRLSRLAVFSRWSNLRKQKNLEDRLPHLDCS